MESKKTLLLILTCNLLISCSERAETVGGYTKAPKDKFEQVLLGDYRDPKVIEFSKDGGHFAYTTSVDAKTTRFVRDGKPSKTFPNATISGTIFSSHGTRFGYIEYKNSNSGLHAEVILDGMPEEAAPVSIQNATNRFDRISNLIFSPDEKHYAYIGESNGFYYVVFDGIRGQQPYSLAFSSLQFSPDSSKLAFLAYKNKGKQICVILWDKLAGFAETSCSDRSESANDYHLCFSFDSKRIAYYREFGGVVFLDGLRINEYTNYNEICDLKFNSEGQLSVLARNRSRKDSRWFYMIDGVVLVSGECEWYDTFYSSIDAEKKLAAVVGIALGSEKMAIQLNEKRLGQFKKVGGGRLTLKMSRPSQGMVLSPPNSGNSGVFEIQKVHDDPNEDRKNFGLRHDNIVLGGGGKLLAFSIREGNSACVVNNGVPGQSYDAIGSASITISEDGQHLAYAALRKDKWVVVVNGQEGPEYDLIIPNGPTFQNENFIEYLAVKSEKLFRIKQIAPLKASN